MDEKDSVETIEKFTEGDEATHDGATTNALKVIRTRRGKKKVN